MDDEVLQSTLWRSQSIGVEAMEGMLDHDGLLQARGTMETSAG
jgi:hypothetical protein